MRRVLMGIIRVYQLAVSPLLGPRCRFHPSCSCYAHTAIERHGALRGSWLGARRLLRCHPFCRRAATTRCRRVEETDQCLSTRVISVVAFAALLYLNYEAWMHDYHEPAAGAAAISASGAPAARPSRSATPSSRGGGSAGATQRLPAPDAAAPAAHRWQLRAQPRRQRRAPRSRCTW